MKAKQTSPFKKYVSQSFKLRRMDAGMKKMQEAIHSIIHLPKGVAIREDGTIEANSPEALANYTKLIRNTFSK